MTDIPNSGIYKMGDKMKIGIIGTGYVGLPTGVGFAELGNTVVCVDKNENKIKALKNGKITLYEEGLEDLFHKNVKNGRLTFTTSIKKGVSDADLVIIAVGTPPHPVTKEADLRFVYEAVGEMADYLNQYTVIATKSTVPVGTGDQLEKIISEKNPKADFDVISLPEFLREGFAVHDFFHPDRIIVGTNSKRAEAVIRKLYEPFEGKTNFLFVKRRSSETIKYASNAFLAIKIHYINEMADFCENMNADVLEVAKGMGMDSRIGSRFLIPGPGYGGSCFPKDTQAMACMGRQNGTPMTLIETAIKGNQARKKKMACRILNMVQDISSPKIAVLGLAFKDGTDDCRESPAMDVVCELLQKGAEIIAYDPKALSTAKSILNDKIKYTDSLYNAAQGADVLVILTEWKEFKNIDFERLSQAMQRRKIVDCRNMLNAEIAKRHGFEYRGIGRV